MLLQFTGYEQLDTKRMLHLYREGTEVNLLATNGRWAMVEKNGCVAYTNKDHLTEAGQSQPEETPAQPEVVWETFTCRRRRVESVVQPPVSCISARTAS